VELIADVVRVDFGGCVLMRDDGTLADASARGKLMGPRKSLGNTIVVGDRVRCVLEGERILIEGVEPRVNAFSRRAAGNHPVEQVVAANLDQVVCVASVAEPEFKAGFADRVLSQAQHLGIPAVLALTKIELGPASEATALLGDYRRAGFAVYAMSAHTGAGIDAMREAGRGRRSLFVGHSGVGKSTLLNALVPGLELLAGVVNPKTQKGRHTTTAAWLVRPEPGFDLIDTPGMRAFGLWGVESSNIDRTYPDFRPHLGHCKFADCRHLAEPGCAVRAAVGHDVAARRFESFLKLREELEREEAHEVERVRANTRYRR
jgi:ribosome biogenesis GTPase